MLYLTVSIQGMGDGDGTRNDTCRTWTLRL